MGPWRAASQVLPESIEVLIWRSVDAAMRNTPVTWPVSIFGPLRFAPPYPGPAAQRAAVSKAQELFALAP